MLARSFSALKQLFARTEQSGSGANPKKAPLPAEDWQTVTGGGVFSVEMPSPAAEDVVRPPQGSGRPITVRLCGNWAGYLFYAVCQDYQGAGGEAAAWQAMRQERADLNSADFRLEREEEAVLGGESGWQYKIAYQSGSRCLRRVVCSGTTILRLDVIYDASLEDKATDYYTRFFASFKYLASKSKRAEAAAAQTPPVTREAVYGVS